MKIFILVILFYGKKIFVWGLRGDFLYALLLLKIIFIIKRYYVYVWGIG